MGMVVLCADAESLQHPSLMGLDDVSVKGTSWLVTFSCAQEARDFARSAPSVDEVWVVSSDEISAVNLAAAIKHDDRSKRVYLVAFEVSGSLLSCTKAADIDGVLSLSDFVAHYALERKRRGEADYHMPSAQRQGTTAPVDVDPARDAYSREAVQKTEPAAVPVDPPAPVQPSSDGMSSTSSSSTSSQNAFHVPASGEFQSAQRGNAFVLSVVSGSGGVGKSTVATLATFCASSRGYRTLLLDCDLQFGDLHYFMGVNDPVRIDNIAADPSLARSLETRNGGPALVACLGHMEEADSFARMLPQVIDILSACFDVIVVNTGAHWAEHHAVLLECSSRVLFLLDQRASSIRSCRRALDLCKRCGIASASFAYAINRCARGALLTSVDASCALQGVHVIELADGGPLVEELLGAGLADELFASRSELCSSIDRALDELLPFGDAPDSSSRRKAAHRRERGRSASASRRSQRETQDDMPRSTHTGGSDSALRENDPDLQCAREMLS